MKLPDRILVPVDFGPNTDGVADAAGQLAQAFGACIRLLYVIEDVPHFPTSLELLNEGAVERLGRLRERLTASGVRCDEPMRIVGRAFDAIVKAADQSGAHLIVLGRGGSGDASAPALGTTTARVMRRTAHPVLAVAPGAAATIRRILCPVDGSSASARGLRNAVQLAHALNARLTVMTVIPDFALHPVVARRAPNMLRVASEYERMERDLFDQFIRSVDFGGVLWDKEVHYGHPPDEIVRLAADAKYDLVVMGSTGRSGLPRILLGSTAETVARRVACSVLTVKREDVLSARLVADLDEINRLLAEGDELVEQGKYEEAIGRFDQCLLKDPYLPAAIEGLASAHERLGHHDQAAELREQADLIRRELWRTPIHETAVLG
jgi:nucleotide-binding universal stress UspA family protein